MPLSVILQSNLSESESKAQKGGGKKALFVHKCDDGGDDDDYAFNFPQ